MRESCETRGCWFGWRSRARAIRASRRAESSAAALFLRRRREGHHYAQLLPSGDPYSSTPIGVWTDRRVVCCGAANRHARRVLQKGALRTAQQGADMRCSLLCCFRFNRQALFPLLAHHPKPLTRHHPKR